MAKGAVGRVQTVLGLIGILALVITYAVITGWNPLPHVASWLRNATSTSISKPAPPWTARAGDEPNAASVVPDAIVVTADGSVEARNPGSGALLWTQVDSWAIVGGWSPAVVVVGRQVGGGFDVYNAGTGKKLWSDDNRDAAWAYRDAILILHCPHGSSCTLQAVDPVTKARRWSASVSGGSSMHGLGKPFASLRPITDAYASSVGAIPEDVPPLLGLNFGGDIHVISTTQGREVHVYPAQRDQRVVVVGHNLLVSTAVQHGGSCTFGLQARDAATGRTLWSHDGLNAHTSTGLGCDQGSDPKGAGDVVLATDTSGRDVLVNVNTGNVTYRAPSGAIVTATDGNFAMVRTTDDKMLLAVSATSGATLWHQAATRDALVGVAPDVVMIADPVGGTIVAKSPDTGRVLLSVKSGATVLGVGMNYLIVHIGRTFGPLLLPTVATVHP